MCLCLSWLSCRVCFVDVEAATDENVQSTSSSDKKQQSQFTPCSPHDIRPLPKAGPRSGKAPSRKRGRTRILTDTPEKLLIEKEAAARALVKKPTLPTTGQQKGKKKGQSKGKASNRPVLKKPRKTSKARRDCESEDEEAFCLICAEPFSNSKSGEKWIQCITCSMWAHEECTDGSRTFVCQNCDSCDDM